MTAAIALAGCGGLKMPSRCRADQMYIGSYSRACWRAAVALSGGRALFISARYGLLRPWQEIDPYEQRMDRAGAISLSKLKEQAYEVGVLDAPVIVLAGQAYAAAIVAVWAPGMVTRPLAHLSIGRQLHELAVITARGTVTGG